MNHTNQRFVAVGFDGTVVKNRFPDVGDAVPKAQATLLELQKNGVRIILSTLRENEELFKAMDWFTSRGIRLFGVNHNSAQLAKGSKSEKLWAHLYIDIANAGCPTIIEPDEKAYTDWAAIREILVANKLLPPANPDIV